MPPITRRTFIALSTAATLSSAKLSASPRNTNYELVAKQDRARILNLAQQWLPEKPLTITDFRAPNSPGGPHDFFSESDYFWPNPDNPSGPYKEIDGKSNPENFQGHRRAMIRLSQAMPALTAAFILTHNKAYGKAAAAHLLAWFVTPETLMTPNLQYAQGVRNGVKGRSYGIIDTLHLVEVARAAAFVKQFLSPDEFGTVQQWFRDYLLWLKTSRNGMTERDATNNHGICWALQASEFARFAEDEATRNEIRKRFVETQLPMQMAPNGSFPRELARTKPYGYSIFNFDCAAALCWSLSPNLSSRPERSGGERPAVSSGTTTDLMSFALPDGRGICRAAEFLTPFLADKNKWPYPHDVQHWESWPVRSPGLLFCGLACEKPDYIALWKSLNPDSGDPEVIRNFPIRQPLLWM